MRWSSHYIHNGGCQLLQTVLGFEKGATMTRNPGLLNELDRAMLRATLACPGTAPAVFTNQNARALLGADKTCMTCPRCGNAVPGEGGKLCPEYRCDACSYAFAKST